MPYADPERKRANDKAYYESDTPERRAKRNASSRAAQAKYYRANKEARYAKHKEWMARRPEQQLLYGARKRAKAKGLECTITVDDIVIPENCPLLGVALAKGTRKEKSLAPTLDRIDSAKGYVPGNVWVICHRANTIKSDASLEELESIVNGWRQCM